MIAELPELAVARGQRRESGPATGSRRRGWRSRGRSRSARRARRRARRSAVGPCAGLGTDHLNELAATGFAQGGRRSVAFQQPVDRGVVHTGAKDALQAGVELGEQAAYPVGGAGGLVSSAVLSSVSSSERRVCGMVRPPGLLRRPRPDHEVLGHLDPRRTRTQRRKPAAQTRDAPARVRRPARPRLPHLLRQVPGPREDIEAPPLSLPAAHPSAFVPLVSAA